MCGVSGHRWTWGWGGGNRRLTTGPVPSHSGRRPSQAFGRGTPHGIRAQPPPAAPRQPFVPAAACCEQLHGAGRRGARGNQFTRRLLFPLHDSGALPAPASRTQSRLFSGLRPAGVFEDWGSGVPRASTLAPGAPAWLPWPQEARGQLKCHPPG